ncbi:hypothetical protein BJ138DRAFT_1005019 [Hygrophoropsis aurantiaca]|uniref:Uncharacterized protein n=1 Tax=Hygrophoropsis aurantiaca TaxID=72124 RepID=A0ACB8AI52_9AGAM|nr:hypothetical protein BJ138DRAFT_1005019 [Hygrophoropsis aurantiaca]
MPPSTQQVSSAGTNEASQTPASHTPPCPAARWFSMKRRPSRSLRWTIYLVPLVLILIAASTRFAAHPAAFDSFSPSAAQLEWRSWTAQLVNWTPHARHLDEVAPLVPSPEPNRVNGTPSVFARGTPTSPTVPVNPVLPTPFPQPFDSTLSTNFSSTSCYNFFVNMTQTDAFRSCRPFSLLLKHSEAFEESQRDPALLNVNIWGTCNTDATQSQCDRNMSWFASTLQSSCQEDLEASNEMAIDTLTALQAYDLMRNAACEVDPVANSYCYLEAALDSDTSSYWFYQLPLGISLLNITSGACNTCTKNLMDMYSSALSGANASSMTGLQQTYSGAASQLVGLCGSSYAKTTSVASSAPTKLSANGVGGLSVILFLTSAAWVLVT